MPAQPRPAHTVIVGYRARGVDGQIRSAEEFAGLGFHRADHRGPGRGAGVRLAPDRPGPRPMAAEVSFYGGVAVKP